MNLSSTRKRDAWLREMEKQGKKSRLITCGGNGVTLDDVYKWLIEATEKEEKR